jgi:capsular exopolysaccharide synthesis family protein
MENQTDKVLKTGTDIQKIFDTFLNYKRVYIVCVGIALALAVTKNMLSRPTYSNSTTIYFSEQDNSNLLSSRDAMEGLRFLSTQSDIENELELLKSFTLIREVLLRLNYHVSYYRDYQSFPKSYLKGKDKYLEEIHSNLPFKINVDKSHPQVVYSLFKIKILDNKRYILSSKGENLPLFNYIDNKQLNRIDAYSIHDTLYFNERLQHPYFSFEVSSTEALKSYNYGKEYYFKFFDINHLTADYQQRLRPELVSPQATLIKISLLGGNIEKVTDFLNELTSIYLDVNVDKKNKIALSTISFIDGQISEISDSLVKAEDNLRNFRASNQVMDLSFQGQEFFRLMNDLDTEKAQIEVQIRYYNYLKEYFSKEEDITNLMAPSTMNIVDPVLTELIANLLELNAERNRIVDGNSRENLFLEDLNRQVENVLASISENVENNLNTLNISLNEIDYRINKLSTQISNMPKTELQLRGIEREFEINDEIYTFLLQKRAESQIVRASNFPDYEVIDPARVLSYNPVGPNKKVNLAIALVLGIFLPYTFLTLKDLLNNKVSKHEDIESLVNVPILGNIFHNDSKAVNVMRNAADSAVAESFRSLQMNFDFFTKGTEQSVIVVSSSMSGEGKSFTTINMANTFAQFGKKTVLLEYDLRRPSISKSLKLNSQIGTTSYLINKSLLEDIVINTDDPNLDIITAGPIPPNPSVLIASDKTKDLIDLLLNYYDVVLIDSAPVGVVPETLFLMKQAHINILISRYNKTQKNVFQHTVKSLQKNNIENIAVVMNDVNVRSQTYKYYYDKNYYHPGAKKKKRIKVPKLKKSK